MIDLNNKSDINRLKKASTNPSGALVVSFLEEQLQKVSYESIDQTFPLDKIGAEYLAIRKTREYLKRIIALLTPEKGD